ncbi:ATP synthase F1 subunit delta [Telmatocola sphagniphila]|jgi:F-type H+-transporting ATPase subunit delta|uniref:ATP synthase subunit delta n=1 Tax=Telmatocola sphagniphila TaxID=1123043 RepID=A0A8E6B853_9BACT|nr:ATP synthase F1 subunit delta [Telmatocola sphagniphila]QVL32298.1 ATP synthase F1 subunit delta [Telmatocola sphagniphila]
MADQAKDIQNSHESTEGSVARRLAHVYAEALMNSAEKAGKVDTLESELEKLLELLQTNPDVRKLISTKGIERSQRTPFVKKAFEGNVDPLLYDFIQLLNAKDRLEILADVSLSYRELRDERAHRIRVLVKSAFQMSEQQKQTLQNTLQDSFKMTPVLDVKVDPSLLGGIVVQVGDEVYDNSVLTRIKTLSNQLLSRSSYEIQIGRDRFSSTS